jgi:phosphatase NudJ
MSQPDRPSIASSLGSAEHRGRDRVEAADGLSIASPEVARPASTEPSPPAPLARWKPSVTVAAIIEREGRFLLVEEHTPEGLRLNNPAGHLEPGESPAQACAREALEETAHPFQPTALVGVYLSRFHRPATGEDVTYLRFAFCGEVGEAIAGQALDDGIVRAVWLTPDEVRASVARHRSPLLMRCMDDYLAGRRLPLDTVFTDASVLARGDAG